MFDTVKDLAYSMKEKVKETVVVYTSRNEIDKLLVEATANENWNIANSKLQILADACNSPQLLVLKNNSDDCKVILDYLKYKLEVPAYEWRRIMKSLSAMEYLLKNGPFRVQQDLRNEMFKVTTLQNFTYYEDNIDKGSSIREKAILLADLLTSPQKLEEEREQARQYREKFYPRSGGFQNPAQSTINAYSSSYSNQYSNDNDGYTNSASSQNDSGTLGNVARNIGGLVAGAGSYISAGFNYIKPGGNAQPNSNLNKLAGFGSDSYNQGYQNSNYNPPLTYTDPNNISKDNQPKWGPPQQSQSDVQRGNSNVPVVTTKQQENDDKLKKSNINTKLWGQPEPKKSNEAQLLSSEKKSSKQKSSNEKKKRKRSASSSSSSSSDSSSSEEQNLPEKQKQSKVEIQSIVQQDTMNLLELDPLPQTTQPTGFSFLQQNSQPLQQQQSQQQDLLDLLESPPQQQQQQNSVTTNQSSLFFLQQNQVSDQQQNPMSQLSGLQFQTVESQNLFSNLSLKPNAEQIQQQQQEQQQEIQRQQELQEAQQKKEPKDAWEMGMGFINLNNLKESQSLPGSLEYIKNNQKSSNNPVYIRPNANGSTQPRFIPNLGGFQVQSQQPVLQLTNFQNSHNPQQIPQLINSTQINQQPTAAQNNSSSSTAFNFLQQSTSNQNQQRGLF
ncbi:UNKNOWN [Stylonychia lemnae]|uniref:ENTH domain-containing protein n=1 Tax=Stylonychia lemnae TaxID=5949 RepID=A0A078A8D0_STYLE|nr:UNKNOWN [Stylonychia lemnae]|eukprot:CDW78484.1 UNKNOWN [Stylonychia lemnae]